MTIRTSVAIVLVLLLILFASLSLSLVRTANMLDESAGELAAAGESIRLAESLKSRLLTDNRDAFLYSLTGDPQRLTIIQAQRNQILDRLDTLRRLNPTAEEDRILDGLGRQMAGYFEKQNELRTAELSPVAKYEQISDHVDNAMLAVERLIELNREQRRVLMEQIAGRNRMAEQEAAGILALSGVILLCVMVGIYYFAARPLARLSRTVESFADRDSLTRARAEGLREIRDIATRFNAMADRLEERRKEQLHFIASIAHDLRNPLHSISLVSELLVHKSTDEDRELPSLVLRQVRHLDHLVQDLLESSRIEAGQMELRRSREDLVPVLRDTVELHRGTSDLHQFILELAEQPLVCYCDLAKINQVLNNLLSNAVKYSPSGGSICVRAASHGGEVKISVSDQGLGIPPGDLEKIFKPFYRTAITEGTIPGIGLGLSASRRIIEAHGGRLWVESHPGEGSVFHISLHCSPPEA